MMHKKLMLILTIFMMNTSNATNINTFTITQNTLAALPKCLHFKPTLHVCLWSNGAGGVITTPVVSHYLPDLVVSVFNKSEGNPWIEANAMIDKIGHGIQKTIVKYESNGIDVGSGNHILQDLQEQNIIFKEADVIGNPALAVMPKEGLLPSNAMPGNPYFQSMVDSALWRGLSNISRLDEGISMISLQQHHVGTGFVNWGGVYPHQGKVIANNDVKGSAVIAQRAADLLTNEKTFGHAVQSLPIICGQHCKAAAIQENNKETYFQMIYPIVQNDCYMLGDDNSYDSKMLNQEGSYIWVVWRYYEGCADAGKFLGEI